MSRRNRNYEDSALEAIGIQAKADSQTTRVFSHEVRKRLEHGAAEYGDAHWWEVGLGECFQELADEGTDLAGWALGVLQVLNSEEQDGTLTHDDAHTCRFLTMQAAAFGLLAWQAAQIAAQTYKESVSPTGPPRPHRGRP
jgi:hypothetical protein